MFNEPPEDKQHPLEGPPPRRRHPLEGDPAPPPQRPPETDQPRPQVTVRMSIVPPYVTYAMAAINVAIFIIGMLLPDIGEVFFREGASRTYEVLVQGEFYRLFTAMFLHASIAHIFFNAYALYIIGTMLEPVFGHGRFLMIYLLGGLGGSVLSVIMGSPDPRMSAFSVGASGAVFAIFGAEMIYLYRHRQMLGERGMAQFRNLLFLLGINFFIGIASTAEGARVRIDNWAHLGGLIGGLVLTWLIGPFYRVTQDPAQPMRFYADDTNTLEGKYWAPTLYVLVLIAVLAIVAFLVR